MQVIIIKWWIIKLLKTLFCTSSLVTNQWNVHYFTPVYVVYVARIFKKIDGIMMTWHSSNSMEVNSHSVQQQNNSVS